MLISKHILKMKISREFMIIFSFKHNLPLAEFIFVGSCYMQLLHAI
jgi:hypothetical protein